MIPNEEIIKSTNCTNEDEFLYENAAPAVIYDMNQQEFKRALDYDEICSVDGSSKHSGFCRSRQSMKTEQKFPHAIQISFIDIF